MFITVRYNKLILQFNKVRLWLTEKWETQNTRKKTPLLYIRKNRTQAVREVPQTNPRGKVFCGGSAVWSDCKRCDASRISGIGKKNGSEEYGQRNSDH